MSTVQHVVVRRRCDGVCRTVYLSPVQGVEVGDRLKLSHHYGDWRVESVGISVSVDWDAAERVERHRRASTTWRGRRRQWRRQRESVSTPLRFTFADRLVTPFWLSLGPCGDAFGAWCRRFLARQ